MLNSVGFVHTGEQQKSWRALDPGLEAMAALGAAGSGLWRSVVQVSGVATELIGMQATKGKVQAVGRAVKPDVEK